MSNMEFPYEKLIERLNLKKKRNVPAKRVMDPIQWITKTPYSRSSEYVQRLLDHMNKQMPSTRPTLQPDWSDRGKGHTNPEWRIVRRLLNPFVASKKESNMDIINFIDKYKLYPKKEEPPQTYAERVIKIASTLNKDIVDDLVTAISDIGVNKFYFHISSISKESQEINEVALSNLGLGGGGGLGERGFGGGEAGDQATEQAGGNREEANFPQEAFGLPKERFFLDPLERVQLTTYEKELISAIERMDLPAFRNLTQLIDDFIRNRSKKPQYDNTIVDVSRINASYKVGNKYGSILDTVTFYLFKLGADLRYANILQEGNDIVYVMARVKFPFKNAYGSIEKVLIIPWKKEENTPVGIFYDSIGRTYEFSYKGVKDIMDDVYMKNYVGAY